jgi:methionyl-tRNA formyltransferase
MSAGPLSFAIARLTTLERELTSRAVDLTLKGERPVRVVFMGTPEFAEVSLRALAAHHEVVGVFTRPDAASGRGRTLRPSAVKTAALELGYRVFEPLSLRDDDAAATIRDLGADIIVVAAYGVILPVSILEAAPLGAINVHGSLLPRWRGAAPVQRAILAGDAVTGVSIMRMEPGMDTGPYCVQVTLELGDLNAVEAMDALARLGADALVAALPSIADGSARWTPQDESLVTYADKISKSDVALSPDLSAETIVRRVRAAMPTAPSRAVIGGRSVTMLEAARSTLALPVGEVASTRESVILGAADGSVEVRRLKPDGKSAMDASAWARGIQDLDGDRWGTTS